MSDKPLVPAIEGWYTMNIDQSRLIGSQYQDCDSYFFPKASCYCKNPSCEGSEFNDVELSRTGKIWSYTNASYRPPEPFVAPDPFVPYAIIAAVQLEKEQLHEDGEDIKVAWEWKPLNTQGASA